MKIEDRPTKEFWDYILRTQNDPKYQNETLPALKFVDKSKKYLDVDIIEFIENENDPPDFDIILSDNKRISLEVTSFTDELVQKYNSFFRTIESTIGPIIAKFIEILPSAGSENLTEVKSMHIEIPDFKFKISKRDLISFLEQQIPLWFKKYPKSKKNSFLLN
jgi:hypothetical protein